MTGRQQLVGFLGVALIVANLVTNRSTLTGRSDIVALITTPNLNADQVKASRSQIFGLLAEIVGLVILVILAGAGDQVGRVVLVFTVGLAAVWALTYYAPNSLPSRTATNPFTTKGS